MFSVSFHLLVDDMTDMSVTVFIYSLVTINKTRLSSEKKKKKTPRTENPFTKRRDSTKTNLPW